MYVGTLEESICHVEDMALLQFIEAITHINEFVITEKIDGAHLRVHLDEDGQMYVTRTGKNDHTRYYDVNDFPNSPKYAFQRVGLASMMRIEHKLRESGFSRGDSIDLEVMLTQQPNAIMYDGNERVIFLRKRGNVDLGRLAESLSEQKVTINHIPHYIPRDNLELHVIDESHVIGFDLAPEICGSLLTESDEWENLNNKLASLVEYISEPSGIPNMNKMQLHDLNLNRKPSYVEQSDWKKVRQSAKYLRPIVREAVSGHVQGIKASLVEQFITSKKSKYNETLENGWLEGVVCEHMETGQTFKIVDRDTFTKVNSFLYKVRNDLTESPRSVDTANSFLGKFKVSYGVAVGLPKLATYAKKKMLSAEGITESSNFDDYVAVAEKWLQLDEDNFDTIKGYLLSLIEQKEDQLHDKYQKYLNEREMMVLEVNGTKHKYVGEVDRRTCIEFCAVNETLLTYRDAVNDASTIAELVLPLMGY